MINGMEQNQYRLSYHMEIYCESIKNIFYFHIFILNSSFHIHTFVQAI